MRQYTREDVSYATFYNPSMKRLALAHTRKELEGRFGIAGGEALAQAHCHLRAVERSASMSGNSGARARTRAGVEVAGQLKIDLAGALEIHDLFPEHARGDE